MEHDFFWYFGFAHVVLYCGIGVSFTAFHAFTFMRSVAKVVWQNRNAVMPVMPGPGSEQ